MRVFVVLSEPFPMVSYCDDQCRAVPISPFQIAQEVPESRVSVGDLAIVEPILISARIWRRRLIRIVGVIKVDPYKMGPRRMSIEPGFGTLHHDHASPFQSAPA